MKKMNYKYFATLLFGLASVSLADNPISSYHYLADPAAASDGEYFYIITDSDDPAPYNATNYDIRALYGFRSRDMQNWTDFGIIYDARQVNGIESIWASGIGVNPNDGKLYIVFPNGASGIGLISADNIAGPWSNPVNGGKMLVGWDKNKAIVDCDGIGACFDPAIFFDDDDAHTPYFTFGGGEGDGKYGFRPRPHGDNFDMYQFNSGLTDIKTETKVQIKIQKPDGSLVDNTFEASYLHKRDGKYYLSYSTDFSSGDCKGCIDYAISSNIAGPYKRAGTLLENPHIDGKNINSYNNNHHGIAEFHGHWYVVYHDRRIANGYDGLEIIPADDGLPNPSPAYHRSVSVDTISFNADGTMNKVTFTKGGPRQIANFNPYEKYPALTSSKQKGVRSRSMWAPGKVAGSILLPLSTKESWIRVSGVDFKSGASKFIVTAGSAVTGNKVEVRTGSATGTLAGTCNIKQTSSKETYAKTECEMNSSVLKGVIDQLFLVFKGSADSTMGITHWEFTPKNGSDVGSSASTVNNSSSSAAPELTPRKPYGGKYVNAPGKIEAENFDIPGEGDANQTYYDRNEGNQSCVYDGEDACSHLREDTDVDLKKNGDGIVVGVFETDEWLEYSVYAAKGGSYTLYVAAVSETGGSLKFTVKDVSGKVVSETDDIVVGESGGYDEYGKTTGATVTLAEGVNIIRMTCTKQYLDVDYFNLVAGENAADDAPIGVDVEPSYTPEEEISSSAGTEVKSSSSGKTDALGMHYMVGSMSRTYNVYDMQGVMLGKVQLDGVSASEALNRAGFRAGRYILCNKYNRLVVNAVDRH